MHIYDQCIETADAIQKDQKRGEVNIDGVYLIYKYTYGFFDRCCNVLKRLATS